MIKDPTLAFANTSWMCVGNTLETEVSVNNLNLYVYLGNKKNASAKQNVLIMAGYVRIIKEYLPVETRFREDYRTFVFLCHNSTPILSN